MRSNTTNFDDSIIMTYFHTKATSIENSIQTIVIQTMIKRTTSLHYCWCNVVGVFIVYITTSHIATSKSSVNKKKIFILGDSIVKHTQGWEISNKQDNKHKFMFVHFRRLK